jgi:aminoglycoside phosphotransferase (APT) family kinase protein
VTAPFAAFELPRVRERLQRYLAAQSLEDVAIESLRRFTIGFSWITFGFTGVWREGDAVIERRLILCIGPPFGIFAPYKASPEFRTLRALADSGAPAPCVHWFSDDDEAFGAPFFVCDFVPGGAPIPWTHDGGPAFDEPTRRNLAEQFVVALAALHRFEWKRSEVESIGGSTDIGCAATKQIDVWESNFAQWSRAREPMLEWAAIWLREHAPIAPRISVVHGDFRIGNFLVDAGRITAILDWELVRLGDPLEDVGWVSVQAWRGRSPYMCHLFTRDEPLERYNALTGFSVEARAIPRRAGGRGCRPHAVRAAKQAALSARAARYAAQEQTEQALVAELWATGHLKIGAAAFAAKRTPIYGDD